MVYNRGLADLSAAFEKVHGIYLPADVAKAVGAQPLDSTNVVSGKSVHPDWDYDPVNFKVFCESNDHMKMLPSDWKASDVDGALSKKQYHDCLAILGDDPLKMFDPEVRKFTFGGLLWAKGSGKDLVCSLLQAYIVHILLCLKDPQDFFGFAPGEPCDILNVGKKGMQAERVYFTKFRARLLKWEWMLTKFNVTDEGRRYRYNGRTFPACKIGTRAAEWPYKNIRAFAENSGDPGSFEGYNIVFFICDEISAWVSESERRLAETILSTLRTSQSSRNTKKLAGLGLAISFPRQDDDIMFDLEKESQKPNSKIFFSRGFQWDVKPKRFYSGKTFRFNAGTVELPEWFDVPAELDEDFFNQHPEKAKCFYLLRPPAVGGPFFEYTDKIDAVAFKDRQPLFKVETSYIDSLDGKGNKVTYVRKKIVGINRPPSANVDYVAWMDAADTMCDAALTIGHLESVTLIEGAEKREVAAVVIDDTIVWEPDPTMRRIVDIGSMTTCCTDMRRYITLKVAFWDQWNSGTGLFDLRTAGIVCDKHNLSGGDYEFFKGIIYSNRFIAPWCPQVVKGVEQVKHLSRTRTGNATTGSTKHKKDIADTWCGVTALLLGNLAPNTFLRAGRAPSSISIGGLGVGGGLNAGSAAHSAGTNPWSQPGMQGQKAAIRDHSDMFRALSPMSRGGGQSNMVRPRTTQVQRQPQNGGGSKFPRGVRL